MPTVAKATGAIEAWDSMSDAIDLRRTQASVLSRLFGRSEAQTKIGRFILLGTAGEGEMGRVYVAHDPELDRKVAVKLIRHFGHDEDTVARRRARMLREAQAMAKVQHPNVIAVHEVGRLGDDVFIVMEYVKGPSLREWLAEDRRGYLDMLPRFLGAARGLAAAHDRDLVHRDFKPDNVLVAPDGRAIVLDFGLARQPVGTGSDAATAQPPGALAANLTRTGAVAGTPAYMAPEQMAGIASDARSDQFSFCVALFEALHGTRPFVAATWEDVVEKIKEGKPPLRAKVPDWLHAAVMRGLRFDPEARHPSMHELIRELATRRVSGRSVAVFGLAAAGLAAAGAATSSWLIGDEVRCDAGAKKVESVWGPSTRAELVAAFEATGKGYAAALASRVAARLDTYANEWGEMHRDACEATHKRHEQSGELLDLRNHCLDRRLAEAKAVVDLLVAPDDAVLRKAPNIVVALPSVEACGETDQLLSGTQLPSDPARRGEITRAMDALAEAKATQLAGAYEDAYAAVQKIPAYDYPPLEAELLYLRGLLEFRLGKEGAERTQLDAVALAEGARRDKLAVFCWNVLADSTLGSDAAAARAASYLERLAAAVARLDHPPRLEHRLLRTRGILASRAGEYDDAKEHWSAALELAESMKEQKYIANDRFDLATLAFQQGDYERAISNFEAVEVAYVDFYGPEHPVTARVMGNRATALVAMGRNNDAIPVLRRARELVVAAVGVDHSRVATLDNALASAHYQLGEFAVARDLYAEALRIYEKDLGPEDARLGPALANLARTQSHLGDIEGAIGHAERAVAIAENAWGPDHIKLATLLAGLGHTYARAERFEEAAAAHRRALALRRDKLGDDHAETAYSQRALAGALQGLGNTAEAVPHASRAVRVLEARLGPDHPQLASALLTASRISLALGNTETARDQVQRALAIYSDAEAPGREAAEAKFILARVIATGPDDRAEALQLAREAEAAIPETAAPDDRLRVQISAAIDSWSETK